MNTVEQAYINGFVKRASEYGYNEQQAFELLKNAGYKVKSRPAAPAPKGLKHPVNLGKGKGSVNELGLHTPHDKGGYLSRIANSSSNPKIEARMDKLKNQNDIDDIVDSLSH
jgi:hypothetical protein